MAKSLGTKIRFDRFYRCILFHTHNAFVAEIDMDLNLTGKKCAIISEVKLCGEGTYLNHHFDAFHGDCLLLLFIINNN